MKTIWIYIIMSVLALLVITGCERKVTNEVTKIIAADNAAYKGSEACQACHSDIYADFRNTGHPFKLNEADSSFLPIGAYYPYTSVPLPGDLSEADVSLVIGGFRWKARYIDNDGYVLTGDNRQYNFETDEFVSYSSSTAPRKPYDCGPCHMPDYESGGSQDGIEGLVGTWAFNGIQCEECHGPGELHINDPSNVGMVIDRSAQGCGKCHIRGPESEIPASGGFIRHHEQWNEMFTTKHAVLDCVDCHDVHKGLHPDNPLREDAIINKCEDCHFKETESFVNSSIEHHESSAGPDCIDCHMAKAAKSAVAVGPYEGDIRSHLFRINTDADAEMFNEEGTLANGYLTLEYTCLTCHASEDKAWAASYAGLVHAGINNGVAGCLECHSDNSGPLQGIAAQYANSIHGSGNNTDRNRLGASYYQGCERCHTSEGFIAYVTGVPAEGDHFTAFDCFTCHQPHSSGGFQVRVTDEVTLENGAVYDRNNSNICATCHHSRRDVVATVVDGVTLSSHWGPHHSNQSDMLIGENAYEYDGYSYSGSWHEDGVVDGCPSCHMGAAVHESIGGHSWNMKNEDPEFENIVGCNVEACHSANPVASVDRETVSDFDGDGEVEGVQTEMHDLLDSLATLLMAAGLLDMDHHPVEDVVISTADSAGALYNFLFVEEDRSLGVHNTAYAVGLMKSSINFLNTGDPNGVAIRPEFSAGTDMRALPRSTLPSH